MPDDSNGVHSLPAGTLVTTGETIRPSQHNPAMQDLSDSLSSRFCKDGRTPATGNWNMNNFKLQNIGDPTALSDAVNKSYVDTNTTPNIRKLRTLSSNYTAILADKATSFRFTANATLSLTSAATLLQNWWCEVWAVGSTVIIDPNGTEQINGANTLTIRDGQKAIIFNTGTVFYAYVTTVGLGENQTWQDVAASRSLVTVYQNVSGKPIEISVTLFSAAGGPIVSVNVGATNTPVERMRKSLAAGEVDALNVIVPDGHYYSVTSTSGTPSLTRWQELR